MMEYLFKALDIVASIPPHNYTPPHTKTQHTQINNVL